MPGPVAAGRFREHQDADDGDVVVASRDGDEIVLLEARLRPIGGVTLQPIKTVEVPGAAAGFSDLAAADVNGDGLVDFVAALRGTDMIVVVLGDAGAGLGPPTVYPVGGTVRRLRIGEVTGDENPDIIVTTDSGIWMLRGTGSGGFAAAVRVIDRANSTALVLADVDNDGKVDIVAVSADAAEVYRGNGSGGFERDMSRRAAGQFFDLAAADFTGDGRLDLALAARDGVRLFSDVRAGITGEGVLTAIPVSHLTAADLNQDGVTELVVLDEGESRVTVLFGAPDGHFSRDFFVVEDGIEGPPTVEDFIGGFLPDLALAVPGASELVLGDSTSVALTTPRHCPGDCDDSDAVQINELVTAVSIALDLAPLTECPPADSDGDGGVEVNELIAAVGAALDGCPNLPSGVAIRRSD